MPLPREGVRRRVVRSIPSVCASSHRQNTPHDFCLIWRETRMKLSRYSEPGRTRPPTRECSSRTVVMGAFCNCSPCIPFGVLTFCRERPFLESPLLPSAAPCPRPCNDGMHSRTAWESQVRATKPEVSEQRPTRNVRLMGKRNQVKTRRRIQYLRVRTPVCRHREHRCSAHY